MRDGIIIGRRIYLWQRPIKIRFQILPIEFGFDIRSPYKKFVINRMKRDIASANPEFKIHPICN